MRSGQKTIFKYPLQFNDFVFLELPKGAEILKIAPQGENVCVWAAVDPNMPVQKRTLRIAGTGHDLGMDPARLRFIDTVFLHDGKLVFHVFEVE